MPESNANSLVLSFVAEILCQAKCKYICISHLLKTRKFHFLSKKLQPSSGSILLYVILWSYSAVLAVLPLEHLYQS